MPIPKIIHYCWFGGGEKDRLTKKCINSWKKYCPDYKIIEWNESNFDVDSFKYSSEAYKNGKWGFVTDCARLHAVYEYGGIYLDTDVELLKPMDELLKYSGFIGFEDNINGNFLVNTGLGFGAEAGNEVIARLIEVYKLRRFVDEEGNINQTPSTEIMTEALTKLGLNANGKRQRIGNIEILPTEYLCPKSFVTGKTKITDKTISIHHYASSWKTKDELLKLKLRRILGEKLYWKLSDLKGKITKI
jgi:hypothetical protein